jgi:hypothetical protein
MSKLAEALRQCEEVLALGYQTGPYAYAGEDIKRYMAEARDAARAALAEHDAAPQPDERQDASRYRWMQGNCGLVKGKGCWALQTYAKTAPADPLDIDDWIDAAMHGHC